MQDGDEDMNASGQIIEDITHLCGYCVKLTEAIFKGPVEAGVEGNNYRRVEGVDSFAIYSSFWPCRLCQIIAEDNPDLGPVPDQYESAMDWSRIGRGVVLKCTGMGRSICSVNIPWANYAIWADHGV